MPVFLALLISILLASPSLAALTCADANAVQLQQGTPVDPETISYTTPTGSNQIVFVGVAQRRGTPPRTHTVTIGGNAMSQVTTETYTDPLGVALYSLVNPPSGTNNVVVDWDAVPLAETIVIFTCSDADTTGFRSTNTSTTTDTTQTVTVPTVQAGDIVIDFAACECIVANTEGANQTVIINGAGTEMAGGASWQAGADGGVMSWTTQNQQGGIHAVVVKPLSAPPASRRHGSPILFP